uniref:Uncharacterized protein n=1 Tax=Schlesneria paludicola TaxID=360056 RepID=A0A7C2JYT8_9PLAN
MPPQPKGPLALSLLITAVGIGWLLTSLGYGPGINWVWIMALGVAGVLTFIVSGGVDKASIVVGPFFLISSGLSILRQSGQLKADTEVPILVITVGLLMFVSQLRFIPVPSWYIAGPLDGPNRRGPAA